jgi:predicted small secreted protein
LGRCYTLHCRNSHTEEFMKYLVTILISLTFVGCGTIGGAVSGAGQDLSKAGEWIRNR